jgi:hypothetical protein
MDPQFEELAKHIGDHLDGVIVKHIGDAEKRLDSVILKHLGDAEKRLDSVIVKHLGDVEKRLDGVIIKHLGDAEKRLGGVIVKHLGDAEKRLDGVIVKRLGEAETRLTEQFTAAEQRLSDGAKLHMEKLETVVQLTAEGYGAVLDRIDRQLAELNAKVDTKFGDHDKVLLDHGTRISALERSP